MSVAELAAAIAAHEKCAATQRPEDIDAAVSAWDALLRHPEIRADPRQERAARHNAGALLVMRYQVTAASEDLERAVALHRGAVEGEPAGPYRPSFLSGLGHALRLRYALHESPDDLDRAGEVLAECVAAGGAGAVDPRDVLELAIVRRLRFERDAEPTDLDEAVRLAQHAVDLIGSGPGPSAESFIVLGGALALRFRRRHDRADLDQAIDALEHAAALPEGDPNRPAALQNLGLTRRLRFDLAGDPADLDRAIELMRAAIALMAPNMPSRLAALGNLAVALEVRADRTGDRAELDEFVIGALADGLDAAPSGATHRATAVFGIVDRIQERYERLGSLDDLDRTIAVLRRSAETARDQARTLPLAAALLRSRYVRLGDLADLTAAIAAGRTAAAHAAEPYDRAGHCHRLAIYLGDRYEHTGHAADLYESVDAAARAVESIPPDSSMVPSLLVGLGQRLDHLFQHTGAGDDLDAAVAHWQQGLDLLPPDSNERPTFLNSLAIGLGERFRLRGDPADLDRSIDTFGEVLREASETSPHRPGMLQNAASALRERYDRTGRVADREAAVAALRQAVSLPQCGRQVALRIALQWGTWATDRQDWPEAVEALGGGMRAGRDLFATQLTRQHKETWLRGAAGFPLLAAYALARTGDLAGAVTALEQGRAMLLSEALDLGREDLQRLGAMGHGDLLADFRAAAEELHEVAEPEQNAPVDRFDTLRRAHDRLASASARIRQVPGYESFLRPAEFPDIAADAAGCPLVYLVAGRPGGLALVVRDGRVDAVWLPQLTGDALHGRLTDYFAAYAQRAADRTGWLDALDQLTGWLWPAVMGPLLAALDGHARVVIVPTGLLALAPLHAAWTTAAPGETVTGRHYALDRMLLTYAPNARALRSAHRSAGEPESGGRLLAVHDPRPSDAPDLPAARAEAAAAVRESGGEALALSGPAATVETVLAEMAAATTVHFACHGRADLDEPGNGGLLLAGDRVLRLRDLLARRLPQVRLAVLSACETGVIGTALPDEVVGLPSGLLQAGVGGVASTLWAVEDTSATPLVSYFYRQRRRSGQEPAEALRAAQRWLRDSTNGAKLAAFPGWPDGSAVPAGGPVRDFWAAARPHTHPYHWAAFAYVGW